MVSVKELPQDIILKIILLTLPKRDHYLDRYWCSICGEYNRNAGICPGNRCIKCCHLHCVYGSNFYIDSTKSEPLTEDDLMDCFQHNPKITI